MSSNVIATDSALADKAKTLPHIAKEHLAYFEDQRLIRRAASDARMAKNDALRHRRDELIRVRWHADMDSDDARVAELDVEIANVRAQLAPKDEPAPTLSAEEKKRNAKRRDLMPDDTVEEFIRKRSKVERFRECRGPMPKGKPSLEMLADALAKEAAPLDRLIEIATTPLDVDTALAAMIADVDRKAAEGKPKVDGVLRYRGTGRNRQQGKIQWPIGDHFSHNLSASAELEQGVRFACWLHRDEIVERLEAEIRERAEDGMSIEEREKAERIARAQWLEAQRMVARVCWALVDAGITFTWPPLHPLALLEVEKAESAKPPKDTSLVIGDVNGGGSTHGVPIAEVVAGLKK